MKSFSIYLTGVGGQGIGLLSEILLRAGDHAGMSVKGVDTHGLAQRGGIVVSRIRCGKNAHSPLIFKNGADLVVALERHEALRGLSRALKNGGTLIYYNTVWQPLDVRLGNADEVSEEMISKICQQRSITEIRISREGLIDARMQNMILLANIDKHHLIPGVDTGHIRNAMQDLMAGDMLKNNLDLFDQERSTG